MKLNVAYQWMTYVVAVSFLTFLYSCSKASSNNPPNPPVDTTTNNSNALPVTIDFTSSINAGPDLKKNLIGTYSPQKWTNAAKIYDKSNVLDPLALPFHKVNLPNVTNIVSDGTWNDIIDNSQPSQKTIVMALRSANVEIHLGMESVPKAMRGDADKVQRLFTTSFSKIREYVGADVKLYYEILNEPELDNNIEWGYYPDFDLFWSDFKNAYIALANKKLTDPNIVIGGPGFELDRWMGQFMEKLNNPASNTVTLSDGSTQTINLDFISYHNYLNWDDAPIAGSNTQSAIDKMNVFYNGIATYRSAHPAVKLLCTEYNWLKSPQSSTNDIANNSYRNCARTMELLLLANEKLTHTDRFYWAQAMGQSADFGDDYFTLENYDWNSGTYKYRSGYYAFQFYQKLPATRRAISFDNNKLNGIAASGDGKYAAVIWNKTGEAQSIKLSLTSMDLTKYNYNLYMINSNAFSYTKGNRRSPALTRSGDASAIGTIDLDKEATVYIEFTPK